MMSINEEFKETKISVIGAGSWGTSLANLLGVKGFKVKLWCYEKEILDSINTTRENKVYLPEITLSRNIIPDTSLERVLAGTNLVVLVVPSHVMRETLEKIKPFLTKEMIFISASKGIENHTYKTMTQVIEEVLEIEPSNCGVLSGPSFARELGELKPTVVTIASKDPDTATYVQKVFASTYFRVYTSEDTIGVEVGGAVKNVIAIASGVADGMRLGLNARAALITRGLVEIRRIGLAMGANPHTFSGLSGVGDLILTCTGSLSRNHTVGFKLGEGKKLDDILKEMRMVAEGIKTAKSVYNLSKKLKIELPICEEIYNILYNEAKPSRSVERLMTRRLKNEIDFNFDV
ncbi:MAG: NAD(P)H-dependent glycerol-3-phosphate dehydrogenase [Desulforegulaceae bacterium]|nr:NAD(P)H-dependent glycerol-3-phosphate dehydrogenase [Desulforegulaceae bacterium]